MIFDHQPGGDVAPEINNALEWCVANGETLRMGDGVYVCTTQIVVPSGAKWVMNPNAILVKDFAGTTGDRYGNALIRNENAPTNAALIIDPGPWTPSTTDDDILIEGGRIRHNEATDIGGGVYMMGVTNLTMRNVTVEHSREDWAFAIGGDDIMLDRLRVEANSALFEDGIHVLYGSRIQIVEPWIVSGDDALAFGTNWNLPISDVTVTGGRVSANKGFAVKFVQNREGSSAAFAAATQRIRNVKVVGLTGRAGLTRNGLVETTVTAATPPLLTDIALVDVDLTGGDDAGHDLVNPFGVRFSNCSDITLRNVRVRDSIRDAFSFTSVTGRLLLDGCSNTDPQSASASYYGVTILSCPDVTIIGGSLTRSVSHIVNVYNSVVTAVGTVLDGLGTGHAGFRLTNGVAAASRLVANGCRFAAAAAATSTRCVRVDETSCSYYLNACDVTGTAANAFESAVPAEGVVSDLIPASRNPA